MRKIKGFLKALDRYFLPTLLLCYVALCIMLLAVTPEGTLGLLAAIFWASLFATALRWGTWGILKSAQKRATQKEMTVLLRTVEVLFLLLFLAGLVVTILLAQVPSVWVFFPLPLFILQAVVKIDAER